MSIYYRPETQLFSTYENYLVVGSMSCSLDTNALGAQNCPQMTSYCSSGFKPTAMASMAPTATGETNFVAGPVGIPALANAYGFSSGLPQAYQIYSIKQQ